MVGRWSCRNPLTLQERIKIRESIDMDMTYREMSKHVGREKSVLVKECNKRGGYENYDPHKAQEQFEKIQRERRRKNVQ